MNCDDIKSRLPLFLYDGLDKADTLAVACHLTDCTVCQAEHVALSHTRAALDAVAVPKVELDPFALLRANSERQIVTLRRWRRAALAVGALAASLLLVLAFRVHVRAGNGEFVIAWGERAHHPELTQPGSPSTQPSLPPDLNERVQLVQELARALAAELDNRDGRTRDELVRVKGQINALQRLTTDRWTETERDVAALYTAIRRPELGGKP